MGYEGGWQHFSPQVGNRNLLPTFSGAYANAEAQYRLNRLDNAVIPRQGQAADVTWLWSNASPIAKNQYPALEVATENFFRISEPSSVFINGFGGTTLNYPTGIPQFSLGGSQHLAAYGTNELLTDEYYLFQLGYLQQLARVPPLLGSGIYGFGTYEIGKIYGKPINPANNFPKLPNDLVAGLIVNTIFGPVEVAYAYGDQGHHKFFFRIGRLF